MKHGSPMHIFYYCPMQSDRSFAYCSGGYRYATMQDLPTLLCLLVPLQLVLVDGVCGTCKAENYPIYVEYFNTTKSVSIIQDIPSLICNEWSESSGSESSGNGNFITDADNDTSASCCFCGNDVSLCENLDHALSHLDKIASRGGLYLYVALRETEDSSAYTLLHPHTLNGNWSEIAILGLGDASIECAPGAGLVLNEFSKVIIERSSWKGCGLSMTLGINTPKFHGALFVTNSYRATLRDVAFVGSGGSSVIINNVLHDPSIPCNYTFQNCSFSANKNPPKLGGGGVHFYSKGVAACFLAFVNSYFESNAADDGGAVYIISYVSTEVEILDCNFTFNKAKHSKGGSVFTKFMNGSSTLICSNSDLNRNQAAQFGGAVYIISHVSTKVEVLGCNFTNNIAKYGNGGAVFIKFMNSLSTLNCSSSNLSKNQATDNGGAIYTSQGGEYVWKDTSFSDNSAKKGGAIYLDPMQIQNTKHNFSFCQWHNNSANISGGAVYLMESASQYFYFFHCHWSNNTANTSVALLVSNVAQVAIINCIVTHNHVRAIFHDKAGTNCIVNAITSNVLLTNVTVEKNLGSGFCLNQSNISLTGANTFANNLGYKGGGINLVSESLLHLHFATKLIFQANKATYGGGLYQNNFGTGLCVLNLSEQNSIGITFQKNYAFITGDSIYFTNPTDQCTSELQALGVDFSLVSSPAANLNFTSDLLSLLLGQNVILNTSITDFFGNPSNVYVYMQLLPRNTSVTLKGVHSFTIQDGMTSTIAYVTGQNQMSENNYFHFVPITAINGHIANIFVTILPCPIGFVYNSLLSQCECIESSSSNFYCSLESANACVLQGYWYGMVDGASVTSPCYSGYCNNIINCTRCVSNENPIYQYCQLPKQNNTEQCGGHRQGILCTECQNNYSFTFGAVKCVSSDTCLGGKVLIPFIVMVLFEVTLVIALVIALKLGYGTNSAYVYGFVYYYSILGTLLPAVTTSSSNLSLVISIFESVTQLNPQFLGYVDICFPTEMTILDQEVLQYINPIFITLIVLGLVFLSRFCSKYVNFRDNTPVRAICLLILLSFTSLGLTSYRILNPVTFVGTNQTYVSIQPSVVYFSGEHIYLFLIASLVMAVFVVPFTLFLFVAPYLMRVCNLVRIKPFLDEFQGCYKDQYRWMAGFYFFCRLAYLFLGCSFTVFFENSEYMFQVLSFGIVIIHFLLQPYKDSKLNIADAILLADIVLITMLYGDSADIVFATLHDFRTVVTYVLIVLPVLVLVCLFASTFDLKSSFKNKITTFLHKRSPRREEHIKSMSTLSTTDLLRPLVDDSGNGGDGESRNEQRKRRFRESMLEMLDSSSI